MLNKNERKELELRVDNAMCYGGFNPPRIGQAYMSCLQQVNLDVYHDIVNGIVADCFYNDNKLSAFIAYTSVDPAILQASKQYGFNIEFINDTQPRWIISHEEYTYVFYWSSLDEHAPNFWEILRSHFEKIGSKQTLLYDMIQAYTQSEIRDLIDLSYNIAIKSHSNQTRRDGKPYITHIYAVANIVTNNYFPIIWEPLRPFVLMGAVLHDTIEDTLVTEEYLREKGIPPIVIDMVKDVTKRPGESYFDFTMRIHGSSNIGSKFIKLADLTHNMSDSKEGSQLDKYRLAYHILNSITNDKANDN